MRALLTIFATAVAAAPGPVLLLYDTDPVMPKSPLDALMARADQAALDFILTGTGTPWNGWGSKYLSLIPALRTLPSDTLVVVADTRDVIANFPTQNAGAELEQMFNEVAGDADNVVFSAEAQCCVSALTRHVPGSFFHVNGSRNTYSCLSGGASCSYLEGGSVVWEDEMLRLARQASAPSNDMYLNAGLQAGYAGSLLRLYECMAIREHEDDQALFTELFVRGAVGCPKIVLDYDRVLFGNAKWIWGMGAEGCPFAYNPSLKRIETDTRTHPFFLHFPNQFSECFDAVSTLMGQVSRFWGEDAGARRLMQAPNPKNYPNYPPPPKPYAPYNPYPKMNYPPPPKPYAPYKPYPPYNPYPKQNKDDKAADPKKMDKKAPPAGKMMKGMLGGLIPAGVVAVGGAAYLMRRRQRGPKPVVAKRAGVQMSAAPTTTTTVTV